MKPRVLFVGRARYRLPLSDSLRLKWDAVGDAVDFRVVAASANGGSGDERFRLRPRSKLDGVGFWLTLPWRLHRETSSFRPDAIVAQSPYEAAAALVAHTGVPIVVEVHGDWRTYMRLYGRPVRRLLARLADAVGTWAVRRATKVRAVSPYTSALVREVGREPAAEFPAYMDLRPFAVPPRPLPAEPTALFVGVLERYKNIDGLAAAWRLVRGRLPEARLRIVGDGTRRDIARALVAEGLASWEPRLTTEQVAQAMDDASFVVLPSRSEGMGRVVIEAFLRGRAVLGSRVGGIENLVADGVNGLLVEPEPRSLADGLIKLLEDRATLERLSAAARAAGQAWLVTPDAYAESIRSIVST
jgi:glycosyltransferase involved in cell wall biosynthesis